MRRRIFVSILATLIAGEARPQASFTGTGYLAGGSNFSLVRDVTADGSITVGAGRIAAYTDPSMQSGDTPAFWTKAGGLIALPSLAAPTPQASLFAAAVSRNGSVIVGRTSYLGSVLFSTEAVVWTGSPATGYVATALGFLPGTTGTSRRTMARGVTDDGSFVVGQGRTSAGGNQAFTWTVAQGLTLIPFPANYDGIDLGIHPIDGGGNFLVGTAYSNSLGLTKAWIYNLTLHTTTLLTTIIPGENFVVFDAISHDGRWLVGESDDGATSVIQGFRYDLQSGAIIATGVPVGFQAFNPFTVTDDGRYACGTATDANDVAVAMLYDFQARQFIGAGAYFSAAGISLTGWTLNEIHSSGDFSTFWGTGTHNGSPEGFIAVIPRIAPVTPPQVTVQPVSQSVIAGGDVLFSVTVTGTTPYTYQWRKDGTAIPGEVQSILSLQHLLAAASGSYDVVITNPAGATTSNSAVLTIQLPVTMITQPSDVSASLGANISFTVVASSSGTGALTYQWRHTGINVPGATGATFALTNLTDQDFGAYSVLVTSSSGSVVSRMASLLKASSPQVPAQITRQPVGVTLKAGGTLALEVGATGTPPLLYQWRRNGIIIPGATSSALIMERALAGDYTVDVANNVTVTSAVATVALNNNFARQINVSTRGFVGTDSGIMITGFVVAGPSSKRLLLRSIGPTLGSYGVTGVLADPALGIFDAAGQLLQSNDNWSSETANASAVRNAATAVGAFSLIDGSKDAALVTLLPPGSYSIKTTGVGNTTGVVIAEAYDLDASDPQRSRLVNLSTRDFVGTGDSILISGFVVEGAVAKTVLVRAVGPTLQGYGVPGTLAKPALSILDATGHFVTSNTGWESSGVSDAVIAIAARVGAFPLTRGSADSCVVAVLAPGVYSAQVRGADGGTGVALVEVYEVP